jgi:hypothetical protein
MKSLGYGACGTVRVDRKGMPSEWKGKQSTKGMQKGEVRHMMLNSGVQALQWKDKRVVTMLSTIHDTSMIQKTRRSRFSSFGQEVVTKPLVIDKYNTFMGGVDKSDQLLSYYGFSHRCVKWYKRAIFHLIDLTIVNAYILSQISNKNLTHVKFRLKLASQLLAKAGLEIGSSFPPQVSPGLSPNARLEERHFIGKTPSKPNGKPAQLQCIVCSHKKKNKKVTTTFRCKQCLVALCPTPCFELYHTKVNPTRYI